MPAAAPLRLRRGRVCFGVGGCTPFHPLSRGIWAGKSRTPPPSSVLNLSLRKSRGPEPVFSAKAGRSRGKLRSASAAGLGQGGAGAGGETQGTRPEDGRMDGRMDGWMEGRTDGWMDGLAGEIAEE